jgi:hypothetical protein
MATQVLEPTKTNVSEIEKQVPIVEKVDYSGAHEKTDPKEIALVKKLDRWIMVCGVLHLFAESPLLIRCCHSQCCGACTGSTTSTAMPSLWLDSMILRRT